MLKTKFRTHSCGELTKKEVSKKIKLCGWIDTIRVQGKIGFLLLRDRYGITQCFLNPELAKEFGTLSKESVISIEGEVKKRPDNQVKKDMSTGEIEISVSKLTVLNQAPELPLQLDGNATEETRLKYRYLDLRRKELQSNLITRHKIIKAMRDYLDKNEFVEIETPILAKSTPEGARDYLVPSRVNPGKFFALPQSPQLFKQLLMVGGYDRYFQIARCFRDEDLRADRQPEFTQCDIEMSFVSQEDIFDVIEGMLKFTLKEIGIDLKTPFPRMTHEEAMKKHKSDKPDLRKNKSEICFLWVTDFPLFEYSKTEKKYVSAHHPFTSPTGSLNIPKEKIKSSAYDLVLNGTEIASGSVRIFDPKMQKEIFKLLGVTDEEAKEKFGFFLNALKFAPPHAGIALGLDRLVALLTNNESMREVIAFPKTKDAKDVMLDAPSKIGKDQLDILGLKLK